MGNAEITSVKNYKYLGVILCSDMTFDDHIEKIVKDCNFAMSKLRKCLKGINSGRKFYVNMYWKMKLVPMIEYACEIWSIMCSPDTVKNVKNIQIKYLRMMYNYGGTSCKKAMFMDNSMEDINIRIHTRKEKYMWKNDLKITPRRINRMYDKRFDNYVYVLKVKHNDAYSATGFPNVKLINEQNISVY